jgi:hypothetical protein
MTRTARCSCGGLQEEAGGEPSFVVACHCTECQRRTFDHTLDRFARQSIPRPPQ